MCTGGISPGGAGCPQLRSRPCRAARGACGPPTSVCRRRARLCQAHCGEKPGAALSKPKPKPKPLPAKPLLHFSSERGLAARPDALLWGQAPAGRGCWAETGPPPASCPHGPVSGQFTPRKLHSSNNPRPPSRPRHSQAALLSAHPGGAAGVCSNRVFRANVASEEEVNRYRHCSAQVAEETAVSVGLGLGLPSQTRAQSSRARGAAASSVPTCLARWRIGLCGDGGGCRKDLKVEGASSLRGGVGVGAVGAEERSLTCPQARGWPVTVPGAGAAGPGFAWPSLFLTVDHDALFKGEKTELSICTPKCGGRVDP